MRSCPWSRASILRVTWFVAAPTHGNRGNGRVQTRLVCDALGRRAIVPADDPFSKMGLKKLAPGQKKPETPTATWEELLAFRMADLTISSLALRSALRGELSISARAGDLQLPR